ncbi:MAG: HEAT repeat domain-containing protein, partial [Planctomycetota bacterium]
MKLLWIACLCLLHPLPHPDELALFRQWSRSKSPELRIQAVRTLRGHDGRESRVALLSLLADPHPGVRAATREEIVRRPPSEAAELARGISNLRREQARIEGLRAVLERREDPTPFATDKSPAVRARALASGRVAPPQLLRALNSSDPITRAHALEWVRDPAAAARLARDRAGPPRIAAARVTADPDVLMPLLRDRSWRVRLAALRACARLRRTELVPELIRTLEGPPGRVRAKAADLLEDWSGAPYGEDPTKWRLWLTSVKEDFEIGAPRQEPRREDHSRAMVTFRRIPVRTLRACFVLDASRSMSKPAPGASGTSRWDLVVRDLLEVLRKLPG